MSQICPRDCPLRPGVFAEEKVETLALPVVADLQPEQAKLVQQRVSKDIYTPVREWQTRIVVLSEASSSDELRAELRTVDLIWGEGVVFHDTQERIDFTALSYTWGEPIFSQKLILNDVAYPITENLYLFLRRCLQRTEIRRLWIDAVCINQHDDAEKSMQVANMLSIYRKASAVRVWLGEAGASTSLALAYLEQKGADLMQHHDECNAKVAELYEGLHDLYTRPYMFRVWIRQEIWAARSITVMCGTRSASWDALTKPDLRTLKSLSQGSNVTQGNDVDLTPVASFVERIWRGNQDVIHDYREDVQTSPFIGCWKSDIVTLLGDALRSQCSVAVDRVYSLVNMTQMKTHLAGTTSGAASGAASGLVLDYSRPMELAFADLARYIMRRERSVSSILCLAASFGGEKLPSWVPDWRKNTSWTPFLFAEYLIRGRDRAENININRTTGIVEDELLDKDSEAEPLDRMSKIPAIMPRLDDDLEPLTLKMFGCAIAKITVVHDEIKDIGTMKQSSRERGDAHEGHMEQELAREKIAAPIPTGELEFSHIFGRVTELGESMFLKLVAVESLIAAPVHLDDFLASPYGKLLLGADKVAAKDRLELLYRRHTKLLRQKQKPLRQLDRPFNYLEKTLRHLTQNSRQQKMTIKRRNRISRLRDEISRRRSEAYRFRSPVDIIDVHAMSPDMPPTEQESSLAGQGLAGFFLGPPTEHGEGRPDKGSNSLHQQQDDARQPNLTRHTPQIHLSGASDISSTEPERSGDSDHDKRESLASDSANESNNNSDKDHNHNDMPLAETEESAEVGARDWTSCSTTTNEPSFGESSAEEAIRATKRGAPSSNSRNFIYQDAIDGWENFSRAEPKDALQYYSVPAINKLCNEMKLTEFATCHNARAGDIIVIVEGCVLPIVLRPLPLQDSSKVQSYNYVGVAMLSYNSIPLSPETADMPWHVPETVFRPQLAVYAHWQALLLAHVKAGTETEFRVV